MNQFYLILKFSFYGGYRKTIIYDGGSSITENRGDNPFFKCANSSFKCCQSRRRVTMNICTQTSQKACLKSFLYCDPLVNCLIGSRLKELLLPILDHHHPQNNSIPLQTKLFILKSRANKNWGFSTKFHVKTFPLTLAKDYNAISSAQPNYIFFPSYFTNDDTTNRTHSLSYTTTA